MPTRMAVDFLLHWEQLVGEARSEAELSEALTVAGSECCLADVLLVHQLVVREDVVQAD